jgi:hypothetical protein
MKIRSSFELNNALDDALAWRKKEITTVYFSIKNEKRQHLKQAHLRASIPILYAHWEGFTKEASIYYLEFVARQRLTYKDLTTNFISISCFSNLKEMSKSNQIYIHNQFIDFLMFNQNERAKIPFGEVIDTESNLSSKVLQNILFTLGLPYDGFWKSKTMAIDAKLLHYRNKIAHGDRYTVDESTFIELHDLVIDSLNYFKTTVENFAVQQKFKRESNEQG